MKGLIRFSLNHASLVVMCALLLVGYAAYRLPQMSVDVFPELGEPTITIMAEAGGLAADEVEQYVSFPVESAVNGLPGVRRVRSASAIGLSIVFVDLEWGTDLMDARQLVSERLVAAGEHMPDGIQPFVTPIASLAGEIMLVSVSSPTGKASPLDLRTFAEFDLRNQLLAVPGVAQVSVIGGELAEYQVNVDQEALRSFDMTVQDVVGAASGAHSTLSAGYLPEVGPREIPIRQQSRVRGVEDVKDTLIKIDDGVPVTIGQVADVRLGPAFKRGTGADGGKPAVVLGVQKSPGTNTLALTETIDLLFDSLEPSLPEGMVLNRDVVRQSHFIERAVDNVTGVLGEAALIVLVIIALFLMNVRTTLITLTALPISLAVAVLLMDAAGLGLNVMTLGGLAVAIGVLVDDAIIDVENVFRRLKQNGSLPESRRTPVREVVFQASNEIRPAMVFATVIIVMVFVPLLFLDGLEGRFFRPLALTYMTSIVASLAVALTVTPALCGWLLRGRLARHGQERDGIVIRGLKAAYRPLLRWSIKLRYAVLGLAALATAAALWLGSTFGTSFLPTFNEGTFTVFLFAPPGTSLAESDRLATQVEKQLVQIEGVRAVVRRTGRAERDEHAEPVSNSEIEVGLLDGADQASVRSAIDGILAAVPGITTMVGQPIEHRLSHVLSGTPAAVAINVYGDDLSELRRAAQRIEEELKSLPGARDVNASREVLLQSLPVRYRHRDLAAAGLRPADAAEQVRQAIAGEVVDTVNEGTRRIDLVVRLAPEKRKTIEQLKSLVLRGRGGALVRLSDVADIGPELSSNLITRENAQRKAVVSLNVAEGYNLGDLVAEVKTKVDPIAEEMTLRIAYGGQFEAQASASRTIRLAGLLTAIVMVMLLQITTGSLRAAVLVMLNLPLALIGGIAAILVTGHVPAAQNLIALARGTGYVPPILSIASMVGFITLFGIAVRGGILLVNHFNHLMEEENVPMADAIVQGSMERLAPILMTAVSAALGLLPLALAAGRPGSELLAPLAIVTLGGLCTSTVLNLLVLPAGYAAAFRKQLRPR